MFSVFCHSPNFLSCPFLFKKKKSFHRGEQGGGGAGGLGVHLSPRIHQELSFRYRRACGAPAGSRQEHLTRGKEYIEPRKTRQGEGTRAKTGVLVGLDLPSAGGGTEAGV